MPDDVDAATRGLLAAGHSAYVGRAAEVVEQFAVERELELQTLHDDAVGPLRARGPARILTLVLLVPMALPLGIHLIRNPAAFDLDWLGVGTAVLCAALVLGAAALVGDRPLDRATLTIVATATASTVGGAGLLWWRGAESWATTTATGSAAVTLGALGWMLVARLRAPAVGRLRDTEAIDRAEALRDALRARLAALPEPRRRPDDEIDAFREELVARAVPMPRVRLFAKVASPPASGSTTR